MTSAAFKDFMRTAAREIARGMFKTGRADPAYADHGGSAAGGAAPRPSRRPARVDQRVGSVHATCTTSTPRSRDTSGPGRAVPVAASGSRAGDPSGLPDTKLRRGRTSGAARDHEVQPVIASRAGGRAEVAEALCRWGGRGGVSSWSPRALFRSFAGNDPTSRFGGLSSWGRSS